MIETDNRLRQIMLLGELAQGLNVAIDPKEAGMIAKRLKDALGQEHKDYIPLLTKIILQGRARSEDADKLNKLYDEYRSR